MGVWIGPRSTNADKKAPVFECTGTLGTDYLYDEETVDGVTRWEIAVLKSCSFTFRRVGKVDMTLIGAGENGGAGFYDYVNGVLTTRGGAGGAGGKILRFTEQTLPQRTTLAAVIGTTNGKATTFNGKSSANGTSPAAGGSGAEVKQVGTPVKGDDGDDGDSAFIGSVVSRLFPTTKFAPGGGGGAAYFQGTSRGAGDGGADGGGNGGAAGADTKNGTAGAANRGAGGGGGHGDSRDGGSGSGGAGGSGILLIRGSITA